MSNLYSIGQINQLSDALERAGFSANDITKLQQSSQLTEIRELLYGRAILKLPEHFIDCDSKPLIPGAWKLKTHRKMGYWQLDIEQIFLLNFQEQLDGKISGYDLHKKLEKYPVLNANILDYLLKNPHLIPVAWKKVFVFFWGTVYQINDSTEAVRCLRWNRPNDSWECFWARLDYLFNVSCPAAILKGS